MQPPNQSLRQVDFNEDKAATIASHIPDWSQFATKQDILDFKSDIKDLEALLIRWMSGIFLDFLTTIGSQILGCSHSWKTLRDNVARGIGFRSVLRLFRC